MVAPSGGRRRRMYGQLLDEPGVTNSTRSSSPDVIVVHPENRCKHGFPLHVKYDWTFDNPGRRYASCYEREGVKCMPFKWVDPQWDARTKGILVKLMKMKQKVEEKKEANDKIYDIHIMKRGYFGDTTNELMNTETKNRHDAVMSHLKMGNDNRNLKAENDARMWKEECAKANMELEATAAKL
uniref:Zinc finger GRF-type domain-containing protein n=1 Tax=Setaria viridis TaxID=4556 RepID=A0A4U6U4B9_SETVI|nr:hypothetical protein SEVIR_6G123400v2 [Setaria viridis]